MAYTYKYPRPAVTVDAIIFREGKDGKEVLLIQRDNPPFQGMWAFPGGFVDMDETLEEAVKRELEEETSLKNIPLHQLHTFSSVNRDPRGRNIGTAFWGLLEDDQNPEAGDDARKVRWVPIDKIPPLAFDHKEMLHMAISKTDVFNK